MKTAVGWEGDLKVFVRKRYCWDFHCLDFLFSSLLNPLAFCNLSRVRSGHPWGNRLAEQQGYVLQEQCWGVSRWTAGQVMEAARILVRICSDLLHRAGHKTSLSELHLSRLKTSILDLKTLSDGKPPTVLQEHFQGIIAFDCSKWASYFWSESTEFQFPCHCIWLYYL